MIEITLGSALIVLLILGLALGLLAARSRLVPDIALKVIVNEGQTITAKRGAKLLEKADCIIYAGSLVNPKHLLRAREGCAIYNSATMTLEEVLAVMEEQEAMHHTTVRLHTGDPSMYGAIREQMDALDAKGIPYDVTPGVSSVFGAAAALNAEFTLPGISQTLILTRMAGRTPGPASLFSLEEHRRQLGAVLAHQYMVVT